MPRQDDVAGTNADKVDGERPATDAPAASPAEAPAERTYLVKETTNFFVGSRGPTAWTGGSYVRLPAGKVISDRHYPIDFLREQGVKLEEQTSPPAGG